MYRVLWAYLKQQYSSLTAYKSAFCMTLVNVFIRIYAYAMLWMTLYKQNASLLFIIVHFKVYNFSKNFI